MDETKWNHICTYPNDDGEKFMLYSKSDQFKVKLDNKVIFNTDSERVAIAYIEGRRYIKGPITMPEEKSCEHKNTTCTNCNKTSEECLQLDSCGMMFCNDCNKTDVQWPENDKTITLTEENSVIEQHMNGYYIRFFDNKFNKSLDNVKKLQQKIIHDNSKVPKLEAEIKKLKIINVIVETSGNKVLEFQAETNQLKEKLLHYEKIITSNMKRNDNTGGRQTLELDVNAVEALMILATTEHHNSKCPECGNPVSCVCTTSDEGCNHIWYCPDHILHHTHRQEIKS